MISTFIGSARTWIGVLPPTWQPMALRYMLAQSVTDGPHETPEFLAEGAPFLSVDGIQDGDLVFEGCRFVSPERHAEYRRKAAPRRGDILMGKAASTGKIARVKTDTEFSIWSPLALLRPSPQVHPAFLEYALKSSPSQAQIDVLCTSNTQKNISMDDIPRIQIPLPPRPYQGRVVSFLDRKTGAIDQLIEKKERLIELLQEKRQALITQAVTKGLDPNAPMKDSGVEWLGKVPAHWEVMPLKRRWRVVDCKHRTPTYIDDGYPLVSTTEVKPGRLDLSAVTRTVGESDFRDMTEHRLPRRGDIIYSRNASLGAAAFVDTDEPFCMGQDVVLITSGRESQIFLSYQLNAPAVMRQVELDCVGSTFKRINVSQIKSLLVAVPPPAEQHAIASFLDQVSDEARQLAGTVERQTGLLHEYRQALISAAVTGQIDVTQES